MQITKMKVLRNVSRFCGISGKTIRTLLVMQTNTTLDQHGWKKEYAIAPIKTAWLRHNEDYWTNVHTDICNLSRSLYKIFVWNIQHVFWLMKVCFKIEGIRCPQSWKRIMTGVWQNTSRKNIELLGEVFKKYIFSRFLQEQIWVPAIVLVMVFVKSYYMTYPSPLQCLRKRTKMS